MNFQFILSGQIYPYFIWKLAMRGREITEYPQSSSIDDELIYKGRSVDCSEITCSQVTTPNRIFTSDRTT